MRIIKYPDGSSYVEIPKEFQGLLQTIYENGKFYNQTTLSIIREKLNKLI